MVESRDTLSNDTAVPCEELRGFIGWYPEVKYSVCEYLDILDLTKPREPNPECLLTEKSFLRSPRLSGFPENPVSEANLNQAGIKLTRQQTVCPWAEDACPCLDAREAIAKCGMCKGRWFWKREDN